ncbi:MAG: ATP-binding protein [Acidobacteriota bacterium]
MTQQRILSSINRDEFVGRDAELQEIVRHASGLTDRRGLVLLAAPGVGAAELLRQAYDQLFLRRGEPVPIHFAFHPNDTTTAGVARRFFQNFLQQYIAYRRVDPSLCEAPLGFRDLIELALPGDYELVTGLVESFERERAAGDESDFVRFCLSAPHRVTASGRKVFHLIDYLGVAGRDESLLGRELAASVARSGGSFAAAGLRRQVISLLRGPEDGREHEDSIHLETLSDEHARRMIESAARRYGIETNEPTRDLIVQQLNASPYLINQLFQAARETKTSLTSFLNCQRLYVDELMGGRINRQFTRILEKVMPQAQTRKTLIRVLYESAAGETHKASLWSWKKRLGVDAAEFERIVEALHVHELANSSAAFIEVNVDSYVWMDYLRCQYRLEVTGEARALVVATTLLETLKRAPQTMARKYRRESALGLRDLVGYFNCQNVPASLFHYDRFAAEHKGADTESINEALDAEPDLIRLPQIVHGAAASAYSANIPSDPERCVVGHGFEAGDYTDDNEIVWLVVEIESKLEASREVTEEWCQRLTGLARDSGFSRVRLWLIAPEGFSPDACKLLNEQDAYGSSRRQVELLNDRIRSTIREAQAGRADEYEMVIPMGSDTELIAAQAVEQIARRVNFRPEAINQIKTALIEACINAAEHSLSPDRKIYQRFRLEDDKLVVTVASRGVVPAKLPGDNGHEGRPGSETEDTKSRRGWGLKLIQTLMDEVEFERVDDGTQLRMTKYLRP